MVVFTKDANTVMKGCSHPLGVVGEKFGSAVEHKCDKKQRMWEFRSLCVEWLVY